MKGLNDWFCSNVIVCTEVIDPTCPRRQLSSMARIRLHKHLFTSLLCHSIISALLKWHLLHASSSASTTITRPLASSGSLDSPSSSWLSLSSLCLALSVLQRYFRSTNYLWMFNEALYLHQLIKNAFTQPSLRPLIVLAYLLPLLTTSGYIAARHFSATSTHAITGAVESMDPLNQPPALSYEQLAADFDFNAQFSSNMIRANRLQQSESSEHDSSSQQRDRFPGGKPLPSYSDYVNEAFQSLFDELVEFRKVGGLPSSIVTRGTRRKIREILSEQPQQQQQQEKEGSMTVAEDDACWLMPSYHPWHEWIINVPNFAILIVSTEL